MNDRSRAAIAVTALAAVALVALWWQSGRRAGAEPDARAWVGGDGGLAIADGSIDAEPSAPDTRVDSDPKPTLDGVTVNRLDTPDGDGGIYASEQPPPDYGGEPSDVIDFDPEPTERPLPPDFVALDEAELRSRRQQQLVLIEERIEAMSAQIDETRDRGGEDMVHVLEARRSRLEQRRDELRQMGP